VRDRLGVQAPAAAIILGSGLGALADRVQGATRVPYGTIPGFHAPGVEGHKGELLRGTLAGCEVLLLAGRFHMYEGHSAQAAAFPVRVVHALGARTLFISNAAGGVRRTFRPGDLMVIADHLNLQFRNPLVGPREPGDTRFPDMSAPWSPRLQRLLEEAARAEGLALQRGIYAGLLGPTYETPAEVRMLERLGADAVGMSTVPEVIVAGALGMEVAGVSCITNHAAGTTTAPLRHEEVMEVGARASAAFCALVERWLGLL
jgi:purine-nucleoside phosphorylase